MVMRSHVVFYLVHLFYWYGKLPAFAKGGQGGTGCIYMLILQLAQSFIITKHFHRQEKNIKHHIASKQTKLLFQGFWKTFLRQPHDFLCCFFLLNLKQFLIQSNFGNENSNTKSCASSDCLS